MSDGVTDDIILIQGTRMPWFETGSGHLKKEKSINLMYVLYILCIIYILFVYYIFFILHTYVGSKVCVI